MQEALSAVGDIVSKDLNNEMLVPEYLELLLIYFFQMDQFITTSTNSTQIL